MCDFSKEILIVSIYSLTMTFLISGRECLYIGLFVGWLGCQFVSVFVLKRLETNPLFDQTKNLLSFQNMKNIFAYIWRPPTPSPVFPQLNRRYPPIIQKFWQLCVIFLIYIITVTHK